MDSQIVAIFCLGDDILKGLHHHEDKQCKMSDAEFMTTSIVAAVFFSRNYGNTLTGSGTNGENCRLINSGTIVANNHNIFENLVNDCAPGASNLPRASVVLGLTNNGGATQTMALPNGSPAINAGSNAICAAAPVNNQSQNGITRPAGIACDIGSVEMVATIDVTIGGVNRGNYKLAQGASQRVNYAGLDGGPVVESSGGVPIIAALRDAYFVNGQIESFAQLMGLPDAALSPTYYFPAYNNVTLDGQLRFAVR